MLSKQRPMAAPSVAYAAGTDVMLSDEPKGDDRDTKERVMASKVEAVTFPIRSIIL